MELLEDKLRRSEAVMTLVPLVLGSGFFFKGEAMKRLAETNPSQYTWFTGHLGDLGISTVFSLGVYSIARSVLGLGKKSSFAISIAPAIFASINEYHPFFANNTQDGSDVAMYLLGWGIAVGSTQFLGYKFANSRFYNLLPNTK